MFFRFRKIFIGLITFIFLFPFLFQAIPAHAQGMPVADAALLAAFNAVQIKNKVQTGFKTAIVNAVVRAVDYFVRKIAYDTAVYVASGGKGQGTLAHTKSFGSYLGDVANNAAGVAIEQLGKPFGLNLCKIPDVRMDLALRLGLQMQYAPPTNPSCTFSDFQKNWSANSWKSQYSGQALENRFNASFQVGQSDIGLAMSASQKIDNMVAKESAAAALQRQEGQGFKPSTQPISGGITSPAAANQAVGLSNTPDKKIAASQQSTMATIGSGLEGSMMGAAKLFLTTLAGTMLKNYMTKGMLPFGLGCVGSNCPATGNVVANYDAEYTGGIAAAQNMFSELLVPPTIEVSQYDVLSNFSNCPDNPGPDNCVADGGLVQAAQEEGFGTPVSIAEALAKNWLHGDWKLIPPERVSDNTNRSCYNSAYCYANIAKLRKARVLPLGFEIATLYSNPDKPWTLKQVVDGFNDCIFIKDSRGNVVGVQNDPINKPFCHLIDPNWVLEAPAARCNVVGYGPSLADSSGPNRQQECVDLSTCVANDSNGSCAISGYCTREKNIWKIDAQTCDAQYRTCKTFQDSTGNTVSYLYRTLDTGYCDANNAGCTAYSLKKDYTTVTSGVWTGYSRNDLVSGDQNSVIYFNHNLSSSCSADSAGCSAFNVASSSITAYLKKAPYYAQCYDINLATPKIDWPRTQADLSRLQPTVDCQNYSQACTPDEVNCNWYTPITYGGDNIPGRFTPAAIDNGNIIWNDQCDARCEGYAAYREMPNNYSNGQSISYIIPSSGNKCSAQDEGCTGFTNLSTTTAGLERVEYFSYLRPCINPDPNLQKKFYTYEGSTAGGYQLKAFLLEQDTDGSPKTFSNTACSEAEYKAGTASLDCRQFNDDQGNVYYKLLSKTIVVSDQCTPYRLDNPELDSIGNCLLNGELRNGQCFYMGLAAGTYTNAGSSQSCSAFANTCHAYKGNAGNNIQTIFTDSFEGVTSTGAINWASAGGVLGVSLESTHVGEHSLAYNGTTGQTFYKQNLNLTPQKSYDLTFWVKGNANSVKVSLQNQTSPPSPPSDLGTVGISDTWQYYHLGPVELSGSVSSTNLVFSLGGNGTVFIDNVHFTEVSDYVYLVKNSLRVDSVCDSEPSDNLPGEALGCSKYQTPAAASVYLTGFSYLCREGAIGCTALFDTFNTPDNSNAQAYNVWLVGAAGQNVSVTINSQEYKCQIQQDRDGCYVNINGATIAEIQTQAGSKAFITTSTVYIPPDTTPESPIYLVANQDATCNSIDLGCVSAGQIAQTTSSQAYNDVLIKNDPASYNSILCQNEAVGCSAYSYGNGTMYFKDPKIIGQKICAYRTNITVNGVKSAGWFWKGVGDGTQPCYPDYIKSGNVYDIWSYGVQDKYKNFVGECPVEQNGCTEFVDHHDSDKSYYVINNDNLSKKIGECNGQVSQKDGCILFDETDLPNKLFDTEVTYAISKSLNEQSVPPTSTANNDANTIIKVTRDRTCGEWLQCRSSHRVWDQSKGAYKEVCDRIGRCDQVPQSFTDSDITNCAHWIDGISAYSGQVLSDTLYRNRDISWKGMDFAGYSLLDTFPIEELSEVNIGGSNTNADWRLVKQISCGEAQYCQDSTKTESYLCKAGTDKCGRGGIGLCEKTASNNSVCVLNPNGTAADFDANAPKQTCRNYPEESAPYPNTQSLKSAQNYAGANLCNESGTGVTTDASAAGACECDYTKVSYGDSISKYWNLSNPNNLVGIAGVNNTMIKGVVGGICSNGTRDGKVCETDADCPDGGTCNKATKQTSFVGWHGYCLEPDISRQLNADGKTNTCLTWYPVDTLIGAPDVNGQDREAGYVNPSNGGRYYCLSGNKVMGYVGATPYYFEWTAKPNPAIEGSTENLQMHTANGLGDTNILETGWWMEQSDNAYIRAFVPADSNNGEKNLRLADIEKIQFTVTGDDTEDPRVGTVFEVWPNDNTAPVGTPQAVFALNTRGGNVSPFGHAVVGKYLGKANEFILMYSSASKNEADPVNSTYLKDDGSVCYGYSGDTLTCATLSGNILQADTLKTSNNRSLGVEGIWNRSISMDDICTLSSKNFGNWHAVRLKFDENTGKFLGYYLAYCDDSANTGHINYDVKFRVRQWCEKILDVSVDSGINPSGGRAVAWTDRLWQKSKYSIRDFGGPEIADWVGYDYLTNRSPFGSIGQNTQPVSPVVLSPVGAMPKAESECNPCPVKSDGTTYDCTCKYNLTAPKQVSGAPFSCQYDNGSGCTMTTDSGGVKKSPASNFVLDQGQKAAAKIFASVYADLEYSFNSKAYVPNSTYYVNNNYTEKGDKNICPNVTLSGSSVQACSGLTPRPPEVRSLNTQACLAGRCGEGNPGITVNDQSTGNVVSPSYVFPANIKFYAFADANQMPLRNVIVSWGDGDLTNLNGYYRNHRGVVAGTCTNGTCKVQATEYISALSTDSRTTVNVDTGKTCVKSADCKYLDQCLSESLSVNFGQILDKSCDNSYFRFDHVYQCLKDGTGWQDTCPDARFPGGCCVFKPSVQVKDNWGWCNGSCDHNGLGGCYDKGWTSPYVNECDNYLTTASTSFFGSIIVAPQ
ncbi:MAG: hypothetical protein WC526_04160 [Patescibacteria group bacterium]